MWSQVQAAGRRDSPEAQFALEALCRLYWKPVYAFLRRSGHAEHAAEDLTQGFFAELLQKNLLQKADPERGRFRSFLLGALKFFVSNQQARDHARKRGGGMRFVPVDAEPAEGSASLELATHLSPERLFDRKWAMTVIDEAMERLATEYRRAGQAEQFARLQPCLTGEMEEPLSELAVRLGKSAGATRVLVFRLRNRFRRLIRAVIANTVSDVEQVERELQHLEDALRPSP
jgi:RNA polymerase sigma factor (sigma-70 family)